MPWKEREIEKLFYSISEVAEMFKVNASLIRFWEKEFDVLRPQKTKKGNRQFTKDDIDQFRKIYHLVKERGYTIQGAREKLKVKKEETDREFEMVKSLKKVRQFLMEVKKQLDNKSEGAS